MKDKTVAAILAGALGMFGVHRFYLEQHLLGVLYLLFFGFTVVLTIATLGAWIIIPMIVGLIDAILLVTMPKVAFNERFNRPFETHNQYGVLNQKTMHSNRKDKRFHTFKGEGIKAFRMDDYDDAIFFFEKALEIKPNDPAMHFNLACSHAMLEEGDQAIQYLEKAVALGFDDLEKIHTHPALAFVRSLDDFELFVENDYTLEKLNLEELPEPLESNAPTSLLEQLKDLEDLFEKGILNEEEYETQKQRLLNQKPPTA